MINTEIIAWILTIVFGILSAVFGTKYRTVINEVFDVFRAVEKALEDNKITDEELRQIVTAKNEALLAIKDIFKRKEAEDLNL